MASFNTLDRLRSNIVLFLTRKKRIPPSGITNPIEKILVVRPNHRLGNQLLLTPLLHEIRKIYPKAKISLLVKGQAAPFIFKSYELEEIFQLPRRPLREPLRYLSVLFRTLVSKYDLAFNAIPTSSSGRLFTAWARAKFKFIGNEVSTSGGEAENSTHMGKSPVFAFRRLVNGANASQTNDPVYPLDIKLTDQELKEGQDVLKKHFDNGKQTIAIYTYATRNKIYLSEWWQEFHEKLKQRFPDYNILEILPVENVSQLSFSIPSFYSRDIREIAALIANCAIWIGADSGMMHLASSSGAPTVGLFKVTELHGYAPYGNGSLGVDTKQVDMDGIIASVQGILDSNKQAGYLRLG